MEVGVVTEMDVGGRHRATVIVNGESLTLPYLLAAPPKVGERVQVDLRLKAVLFALPPEDGYLREIKAQALEEIADELTVPARKVGGKARFYLAAPDWLRSRAETYRAKRVTQEEV